MARWLIAGATGMLGRDMTGLLRERGEDATGHAREDMDITDESAVATALAAAKPDVVVNCAAWTAVDDAEGREDEAFAVNGRGAANLAAACADVGALLVHTSTDYVFDGGARTPYPEDAVPAPRTAYGRTKLAGERAVLDGLPGSCYVVRTAWLYGAHGRNFVHTMLRLARAGMSPAVVSDQLGQPTWTRDVAAQIYALVSADAPAGVYHATSSGDTTWFGLAEEVFRLCWPALPGISAPPGTRDRDAERARPAPRPVTTADFPRPAPRPANSVLGHAAWAAAGIAPIGDWRDALRRAFPEMLAAAPPG